MPEETSKPIEKPWAVYGWFLGSWDIGRVFSESTNSVYLKYCEGQYYSPECWDSKWVKRFDTSSEAIDYFFEHQGWIESPNSKQDLTKRVRQNFPQSMKQESLQTLHDTLVAYKNKRDSSQTLPKCTPLTYEEDYGPFGENPFKRDGDKPHPFKKY